MSYQRNRTLLKDADVGGSFEIQDLMEVDEEISQSEIEAIIADEMKVDRANEGASVIYEGSGTSTSI